MDINLHERLSWIGETLLGVALMVGPFLIKLIDDITIAAHFIVAIGGVIITVLGVKRAIRHERRNREQNAIALDYLAKKGKRP